MKKLSLLLLSAAFVPASFAGGLDRSQQSISPLFEEGRYFEFSLSSSSPDVSGSVNFMGTGAVENGNIAPSFTSTSFAYKADLNSTLSYALILDTPYGASVSYPADSNPIAAGLDASVNSRALTALLRYKYTDQLSFYGGVRFQSVEANYTNPALSYVMDYSPDMGTGYVIGAAWENPALAQRVALTYNSAISYGGQADESSRGVSVSTDLDIETPASFNLDMQTGITPTTLLFGSVRYAQWSNFSFAPIAYQAATGSTLLEYADNSTRYSLGVGQKINDQLSLLASVSYEAASGSPGSLLSPTDGEMGYTLGAIYTMANGWGVTAGLNMRNFGDVDSFSPAFTGSEFSGNSATSFGLKLSKTF